MEKFRSEESIRHTKHASTRQTGKDNMSFSNKYTEKRPLHNGDTRSPYDYNPKDEKKGTLGAIFGFIRTHLMVLLIITGAFLGFIIGYSINAPVQELSPVAKYNLIILIGFPGELLIRMLKLLILPLITCSLITGLAVLDSKVSGRVGLRAVVYYLSTTVIAAILGIILVSAIQPGSGMSTKGVQREEQLVRPLDSFMDIIRNMFPSNIIKACVQQDKTVIVEKVENPLIFDKLEYNITGKTQRRIDQLVDDKLIFLTINPDNSKLYYTKKFATYRIGTGLTTKGSANYLGIIVFAIVVGIAAGSMGERNRPFVDFLLVLNEIITKLIIAVMWYAPIGICSLIMSKFAEMDDMAGTFKGLGLFIVTVVVAIGIHGLILLPALFFLLTRTNPYVFLKGMLVAMATAFGTDSSAATLPVTFRCLEENLKVDKRITRFILPVGTTINMDGTALYEAVSAIFIAQTIGRSLSVGDYIAISFTSILASMGAAAIPHAGLVTMLIVLDTVGLPTDMVAVIFSVDWFLDRCRTMINVLGDAYGAGIVQHLSKADLEKADREEDNVFNDVEPYVVAKNIKRNESFLEDHEVESNDNDIAMRERKLTYC